MKNSKFSLLASIMAVAGIAAAQATAPVWTPTPGRSKGKIKSNRYRGKAGTYGRGLVNHFNRKRQQQQQKLPHLRDDHGAYTMVGKGLTRRTWLAGISAQRGY
jgi:hypothetical protein